MSRSSLLLKFRIEKKEIKYIIEKETVKPDQKVFY